MPVSSISLWRTLALVSTGAALYMLCHAPSAPARGSQVETADADDSANAVNSSASACQRRRATTSLSAATLGHFVARLSRARSLDDRCRALHRLATLPGAPDSAVALIASYARAPYDHDVRRCAVWALGDAINPSALTPLLELTAHVSEAPLGMQLVRALGQREEDAAKAALRALARSSDSPLRVNAAIELAERGEPHAIDLLLPLLEGADDSDARALVRAIGASQDPRALGALQDLIARGSGAQFESALGALASFGDAESTRILLRVLEQQPAHANRVLDALSASPDPNARRALITAAEGGTHHIDALQALRRLREADGDDVTSLMLRALTSREGPRIGVATEYFAGHGDPRAVPALAELAQSSSPRVGGAAVDALARIGGDAANEALEDLARTSGPLQSGALSALSMQPNGEARAREIALELMERGGHDQSHALEILASDPSPAARAALSSVARRTDARAEQAIGLLGQRDDEESRKLLVELARSDSPNRMHALQALAPSGAPEALDAVRFALKSPDGRVRSQAVGCVTELSTAHAEELLLQASRDEDSDVVAAAATSLQQVATPAALERLVQLASSPDSSVMARALESLTEVAPERASSVVRELADSGDHDKLVVALGNLSALPAQTSEQLLATALATADTDLVERAMLELDTLEVDRTHFTDPLAKLAHDAHLPSHVRNMADALLNDEQLPEVAAEELTN